MYMLTIPDYINNSINNSPLWELFTLPIASHVLYIFLHYLISFIINICPLDLHICTIKTQKHHFDVDMITIFCIDTDSFQGSVDRSRVKLLNLCNSCNSLRFVR